MDRPAESLAIGPLQPEPLPILYRDEWLVAVHKPAGLLVHRSAIDRHETRFAMQIVRDQIGAHVYPVHRLDKPTSGLLLFALDPETARAMSEIFAARETRKTYLAIARGYCDAAGRIDYALKEELDRKSDRQARTDKPAQPAVTDYRLLATIELPYAVGRYDTARYSLLELTPHTGRKHQLRRHLKHIFHPIVGDTSHGDGKQNSLFRDRFDCRRLMLAAVELGFSHPHTGAAMRIVSPLEESFALLLEMPGWQPVAEDFERLARTCWPASC